MIKDYKQIPLFEKKVFEKAYIKPPFRFGVEMPNEACFYYVVSGSAQVLAPTEKIPTATDDGVVMQCGSYFNEYLSTTDNLDYCEAIAIHLYPEVLKSIYSNDFPDFLLETQHVEPLGYVKYQSNSLLKSYIESLQFYFEHPELASEDLLKLKLKELIILLAKTDNAQQIRRFIASLFTEVEISFKEIIEANLFNNLSVEELAKLTNLSLSSFKREFVKNYDTSPAKYIKKRKLEKACKLLKGTHMRISDIAFECGFSDLAHFSKSFQKAFQSSPSDYRLS